MNKIKKVMNWIEEKLKKPPAGLTAFLISVMFLILGFFALWFTKSMLKMGQDAVLVSVVLIPVLLYLILSGKLQEFSGGGLSLKFTDVARKPLDESNTDSIDPRDVESLAKEAGDEASIRELQRKLQHVSRSKYIVLTVTLGGHYYKTKALLAYLREFAKHPNFKFLVVLKQNGAVFAYISGWRVIQILEMHQQEQQQKQSRSNVQESGFVVALNEGWEQELLDYGLVQTTLRTTDTNITALKEMTDLKMDALIVMDDEHMLKGVVDREQVLSKLMLAINKSV